MDTIGRTPINDGLVLVESADMRLEEITMAAQIISLIADAAPSYRK